MSALPCVPRSGLAVREHGLVAPALEVHAVGRPCHADLLTFVVIRACVEHVPDAVALHDGGCLDAAHLPRKLRLEERRLQGHLRPVLRTVVRAVRRPCHAELLDLRARALARGEHEHHPVAHAVDLRVDGAVEGPLVLRDHHGIVLPQRKVDAVVAHGVPDNAVRRRLARPRLLALREKMHLAIELLHAWRNPAGRSRRTRYLDLADALPMDKVAAFRNRAPPVGPFLRDSLGTLVLRVGADAVVHQVASADADHRRILREGMSFGTEPLRIAVQHQRRHFLERDLGAGTLFSARRDSGQ